MTGQAPIVPLRTKLWCADETLRMILEPLAMRLGTSIEDTFWEFVKSPVYDALYDGETGMWAEGPAMLLDDFFRCPI